MYFHGFGHGDQLCEDMIKQDNTRGPVGIWERGLIQGGCLQNTCGTSVRLKGVSRAKETVNVPTTLSGIMIED